MIEDTQDLGTIKLPLIAYARAVPTPDLLIVSPKLASNPAIEAFIRTLRSSGWLTRG